MQRINIYYGGRGLIEDPTIYVMNKLAEVLSELNIDIKKYNLYEDKRGISVLPKTLKEADGVILAASVEWLGIGGLLQQFLDACWLYGDKERIRELYMLPVVTATTAGEKRAYQTLIQAWEILGGIPCEGICTYVADYTEFETNPDYALLIEKKEDIEELTSMFKGLLGDDLEESGEESSTSVTEDPFANALKEHFHPVTPLQVCYNLQLEDGRILSLDIDNDKLTCSNKENPAANVQIRIGRQTVKQLMNGEITMHNAFLSGAASAKGDFKQIRTFDTVFPFRQP